MALTCFPNISCSSITTFLAACLSLSSFREAAIASSTSVPQSIFFFFEGGWEGGEVIGGEVIGGEGETDTPCDRPGIDPSSSA